MPYPTGRAKTLSARPLRKTASPLVRSAALALGQLSFDEKTARRARATIVPRLNASAK